MSQEETKPKILVVDDAEDNRVILSRFLVRAGFSVEESVDGVDAMSSISRSQPTLVLLDWMMPQLSGLEVLQSLRQRFDATQLPIIMCTARDEPEAVVAALSAGANDYVTKPIQREVVLARVRSQLDRKHALDELAMMNADLGKALADRTKSLLEMKRVHPFLQPDLDEILRLADWLQTDSEAGHEEKRKACAASIVEAVRRLSAA